MRAPDKALPPVSRLNDLMFFEPKTGLLLWKSRNDPRWDGRFAGKPVGYRETNGYMATAIDGRRFLVHRLAWKLFNGTDPVGCIDHADGNRLNNRPDNLRQADSSTNQANAKLRANAAPLKGAHWNKSRGYWQSSIKAEGRSIFLGRFDTPEDAHAAYLKAAERYFGEFARAG